MLLRKNERQSARRNGRLNAYGKNLPFYETKKFAFLQKSGVKRLAMNLKIDLNRFQYFATLLCNFKLLCF